MRTTTVVVLLFVGGCGDQPPSNNGGSYFPVSVGNRWVYAEIDKLGVVPDKTDTKEITGVTNLADGREAFVMLSTPGAVGDVVKRFTWVVEGNRVDRVRAEDYVHDALHEQHTYEPGFARFNYGLVAVGDTFTQEVIHTCTSVSSSNPACPGVDSTSYTWSVESVSDVIDVPAGTFSCLKIRRHRASGQHKTYWYAPGVGKVYEDGVGNIEELLEYQIAE
ncbi:hypothetical protein ACFL6C_05135 [Myxococcota bacterium]